LSLEQFTELHGKSEHGSTLVVREPEEVSLVAARHHKGMATRKGKAIRHGHCKWRLKEE
jgi:hypothetical protein